MQTELLNQIIERAEQKKKDFHRNYLSAGCIYLAMLDITSKKNIFSESVNENELHALEEKLKDTSLPDRDAVVEQLQKESDPRDQLWNRTFLIWMSMKNRTASDALTYVMANWPKTPLNAENHPDEKETTENDEEHLEKHEIYTDAADVEESANQNQTMSLEQLARKTMNLRENLQNIIIGQNYAIRKFTDAYFQGEMFAFMSEERKGPRSVFLFAGSPGVGKTFLATEAARFLGLETKRFDMSSYADDSSAFDLTGADSNFKDPRPGELTGFVKEHPQSVLIFDEVEKAHPKVINLFLQVLDVGYLYDSRYQKNISFLNTIVIFTTNAGKQLYQDPSKRDFSNLPKKIIIDALEKDVNPRTKTPYFPQALCSRLATGCVVMFNRLGAGDLIQIAADKLLSHQDTFLDRFSVRSYHLEDMASTLLFAMGGKCDARNIVAATGRFFSEELLELSRLVEGTHKDRQAALTEINWRIDLSGSEQTIVSMYEPNPDGIILFFGEHDHNLCENSAVNAKVLCAADIQEAKGIVRNEELMFVILDYLHGAAGHDSVSYLNAEDRISDGRTLFSEIREMDPDLPVYILETDRYQYNREEEVSLLNRGARGILAFCDKDQAETALLLNEICLKIHHQKSLDMLDLRHKVLSYESSQALSEDGTQGEIRLFDFHLSDAIEAEDQKNILSAEEKPDLHWDDIVVSKDVKEELLYFSEYLHDPKGYLKKGAKVPKGVLLYGPPGTGKTSLAKVMAADSKVTFLTVSADQFFSRWAGEGPESVHRIFAVARKYAPAILFIDEIDSIGRSRSKEGTPDGQQEILNALLTEMDGFKTMSNKPVLVMAATNLGGNNGNTRALDAALVRRFDRSINIDLPDKEGRIKLLRILQKKNPLLKISDMEIDSLAERSVGMSPALIEGAVNTAVRDAIRSDCAVTDELMDEAFEKYNSGEEKPWDKEALLRTARHEAGHAFICNYYGETPSYLTIVARDDHGGYMQHESREHKGTYTKKELLHRICTAMGGRAAELVYYGEEDGLTTGAASDLANATGIAERMICSYGLYGDTFVGRFNTDLASEGMSEKIYACINQILLEQMSIAKNLILENKGKIDQLVEVLLEKMHLSAAQIRMVLDDETKKQ